MSQPRKGRSDGHTREGGHRQGERVDEPGRHHLLPVDPPVERQLGHIAAVLDPRVRRRRIRRGLSRKPKSSVTRSLVRGDVRFPGLGNPPRSGLRIFHRKGLRAAFTHGRGHIGREPNGGVRATAPLYARRRRPGELRLGGRAPTRTLQMRLPLRLSGRRRCHGGQGARRRGRREPVWCGGAAVLRRNAERRGLGTPHTGVFLGVPLVRGGRATGAPFASGQGSHGTGAYLLRCPPLQRHLGDGRLRRQRELTLRQGGAAPVRQDDSFEPRRSLVQVGALRRVFDVGAEDDAEPPRGGVRGLRLLRGATAGTGARGEGGADVVVVLARLHTLHLPPPKSRQVARPEGVGRQKGYCRFYLRGEALGLLRSASPNQKGLTGFRPGHLRRREADRRGRGTEPARGAPTRTRLLSGTGAARSPAGPGHAWGQRRTTQLTCLARPLPLMRGVQGSGVIGTLGTQLRRSSGGGHGNRHVYQL